MYSTQELQKILDKEIVKGRHTLRNHRKFKYAYLEHSSHNLHLQELTLIATTRPENWERELYDKPKAELEKTNPYGYMMNYQDRVIEFGLLNIWEINERYPAIISEVGIFDLVHTANLSLLGYILNKIRLDSGKRTKLRGY